MKLFLVLLLFAALIAVLVVLAMGLVNLAKTGPADLAGDGPSERALKSNQLMWKRIYFQGGAILIAAVILMLASGKG